MPKPEVYVVYTGDRGNKPDTISLSKEFFDDEKVGLDIEARVIYESDGDGIINQYIKFTKVYDEQRRIYGRKREAVLETIRICKDRNLLRDYLESREKEVITIMMSLFDEEEIMKSYIRSERKSERHDALCDTARNLIKKNQMSIEDIAEVTSLPVDVIKKLKEEMLQPV
jgi:hypothetical protein